MSTGEDEGSSSLNGRLRPRKSTSTSIVISQNKSVRRSESKLVQDRPKRASTSSKTSPWKQDDLVTKSDTAPASLFLCSYCDRKFNARQTASKHARRIHLSTTKQDNFIKCIYCNHSDAESNTIIKHMVDCHPNQYFACLVCHTRFPSTTELAQHKLHVCEKQKPSYRSKLRQKSSPEIKKNPKTTTKNEKTVDSVHCTQFSQNLKFNGIVISCELKPSETHDTADIEDKITTNYILPSAKSLGKTSMDKNAVIVLDDMQWNKRLPPSFSFHNTDADQILSRLGVVHRSPRVGESRKDLIRFMDEPNEKFEKCFDTSFYSRVARNVQENLSKYVDGTFNFDPNKDSTIKTRKSKASVMINTAEGFPILLVQEQFSRNLFDGFIPRAIAPKHKWKWDSAENDKSLIMLLDQTKRDSHVNNCIITLISSLDIWTQLRMKRKFEEIFKTTPTAKKAEKQNVISMQLKEILESRDIPATSSQVVQIRRQPVDPTPRSILPAYLGLSATSTECELQPAVLSGEWVRPRCYVCCACGEQTRDGRTLTTHMSTQHPNAQVQHYEIVGETLLSADILKHLYVPPSQMSNRTRPPRGFRDCTKCKKSITLEDLHQHMLDCAGDTPAVRRKCRYRPFGVRRRRHRLPENTIRKKIRKDMRSRHRQKSHMRPRPRIRTEVGDAETIRKMIADLPAKRNRITPANVLRPRRTILKTKKQLKLRSSDDKKSKLTPARGKNKTNKTDLHKKEQNDTDNSSSVDEDDQPLKLSASRISTRSSNSKEAIRRKITISKNKKRKAIPKKEENMEGFSSTYYNMIAGPMCHVPDRNTFHSSLGRNISPSDLLRNNVVRPAAIRADAYPTLYHLNPSHKFYFPNQLKQSEPGQSITGDRRQNKLLGNKHTRVDIDQPTDTRPDHRIDLTSANPRSSRQHSSYNSNDYNTQGGKQSHASGGDNNQNSSTAQVPNVPLKHSIASLTSDTEGRDSSSYHYTYTLTSEMCTSMIRKSTENLQEFVKEPAAEEVDKPPLSNYSTESLNYPEKRSASVNFKEPCSLSPQLLYSHDTNASRDSYAMSLLQNDPIRFRASSGQMHLVKDSTTNDDCVQHMPEADNFKDSRHPIGETYLQKNVKEPVLYSEAKIGTEKAKSTKTRKGLKIENCIAMLLTKKGIGFDRAVSEPNDTKTDNSENTITGDPDLKILATATPEPSVTVSTIDDKNNDTNTNDAVQTIEKHHKDESLLKLRSQSISNDQPLSVTNNTKAPEKTYLGSDIKTPTNDAFTERFEAEAESNIIRPPSQTGSEVTNELSQVQVSEAVAFSDDSLRRRFEADIAILHLFWDTLSAKMYNRDSFSGSNVIKHVVKSLIELNIPYLAKIMTAMQNKFIDLKADNQTIKILHDYTYRLIYEEYKSQILPEQNFLSNFQMQYSITGKKNASPTKPTAIHALLVPQDAAKTEKVIEENMPSLQTNVSPTSRKTKRKPIIKKNKNLEREHEMNELSLLPNLKTVPPMCHDPQRIRTSPIDSKPHLPSYLPATSPSSETQRFESLSSSPFLKSSIRARRESSKRVSNGADPRANTLNNDRKSITIHPELLAERIKHDMIMQNLRSSIESANAQATLTNYNSSTAQAYLLEYEKTIMNVSQASGEHMRKPCSENFLKDNQCQGESNKLLVNNYPASTSSHINQNSHEVRTQDKPKSASSNVIIKCNTQEAHDNYKPPRHDNEQCSSVHRQRCDNLDSNVEHVLKYSESLDKSYTAQKAEVAVHNRPPSRRRSEVLYAHTSPYKVTVVKSNLVKNTDNSSDIRSSENMTPDNSLRVYQEPVPPFAVPSEMRPKNISNSLAPPSRESNIEDLAPLDLSCVTRKEITRDLTCEASDLSTNNSFTKIDCEDLSVMANFQRNVPIRPLLHKPPLSAECKLEQSSDESFSTSETFKNSQNEVMNPSTHFKPIAQTEDSVITKPSHQSNNQTCVDDEMTNKIIDNLNEENNLLDRSSPPRVYNNIESNESRNTNTIHPQDSTEEKTFFDTKKIIRPTLQTFSMPKSENSTVQNNSEFESAVLADPENTNTNLDPLASDLYASHTLVSANIPTPASDANSDVFDACHAEKNLRLRNQKVTPNNESDLTDQDAETARKIAMLPEELVKILGTIPKNHRNQLLNILPQYVSAPVPHVVSDIKNTPPIANAPKMNALPETIHNTTSLCDSNRFSGVSVISPSSVIPKKRYSPAQSQGKLNSNEPQASLGFCVSTIPQRSPIYKNDSRSNIHFSQHDNSITVTDSDSSVFDKKEDAAGQLHLNKEEFSISIGTTSFPGTPIQISTSKLLTKQKPPNEQTASLRAVRIKPTSARKSLSEDRKAVANYCYTKNISIDDKYTNPGQSAPTKPQEHNHSSDLNDEHVDSQNIHFRNDVNAGPNLRDTPKQNNYIQDRTDTSIVSKNVINNDEIVEHSLINETHANSLKMTQENKSCDVINPSAATAGVLDHIDVFSKRRTEIHATDNDFSQLDVSIPKLVNDSCNKSQDMITRSHLVIFTELTENMNTTEVRPKELAQAPDIVEISKTDSSNSQVPMPNTKKAHQAEQNVKSVEECVTTHASSIKQHVKGAKEAMQTQEKLVEDDSEDDETLAVIKQKHSSSVSIISKISSSKNVSQQKVVVKQKKKIDPNKMSKSTKRKMSKRLGNVHGGQVFDSVTSCGVVLAHKDGKKTCNDLKNSEETNINALAVSDKPNGNSIDVNKENDIAENHKLLCENYDDYDTVVQEPHETVRLFEKNSRDETKVASENKDIENDYTKNDKTYHYTADKKPEDKNSKNPINIKKAILDKEKTNVEGSSNDKIQTKLTEDSTIDFTSTSNETLVSIAPSDFQLCSEVPEVILPLRRSRRGKSMYVDSSYLEDCEKIEDDVKKAPLTMKRLILSRVEKDKKRITETSVTEKSNDAADDFKLVVLEKLETPTLRKGKLPKRKKSPHTRRTPKKTKSTSEPEVEHSDVSNLPSESNILILRELPNAENKIPDSCKDDMKCRAGPDNLSENTSRDCVEKESEVVDDSFIEVKESTIPGKRKLNVSKVSDKAPCKIKKSKIYKNNSYSDFDSDDDKVLLETKQKVLIEKHSQERKSNKLNEEVNSTEMSEYQNEGDKLGNTDNHKQAANVAVLSETRMTCYSRSISNKKSRTSSSIKDDANYDPYDIDFIDIFDTAEPKIKKKGKNRCNKIARKLNHDMIITQGEDLDRAISKVLQQNDTKTRSQFNNESDSDSSKSDVPLQKYVEEKANLELELKNKTNTECDRVAENDEILVKNCNYNVNEKCLNTHESHFVQESCNNREEKTCNTFVEDSPTPSKTLRSTKFTTFKDNTGEDKKTVKDENVTFSNKISLEPTKQITRQKKSHRAPTNVSPVGLTKEVNQQLQCDKFMESFGFYSEKIPRKSNLMATKKISETFNMISNERDFLEYKEKPPRKTNQIHEHKRKSESNSDTAPQGLKILECDRINLVVEPTTPKTDIEENLTSTEPNDSIRMDDSDLDSLTAQAIMDSEEVRNLENDLFSGLREAAEANAASNCFVSYQSTSDLDVTTKNVDHNDSILHTEEEDVCHKVEDNLEQTKKSKRCKQIKQPDFKSKMYPDIEEIDMFEDKFDKIKRKRRSQAVAAKQVQVSAETKTSFKSRKQSEKKRMGKNSKKNPQSTHVPTKGALKGFEGIKISIPTQDLNLPISVSPPRQLKKRRKTTVKRRKDVSVSDSSSSEFEGKDISERDIYEFIDSEDAELFDLRPSTVMDRFRSMHKKNKSKYKDKDKTREMNKDKAKRRDIERKVEVKDKETMSFDAKKEQSKTNENIKEAKKSSSRDDARERDVEKETHNAENNLGIGSSRNNYYSSEISVYEDTCTRTQKGSIQTSRNHEKDIGTKKSDDAVPGTSGIVPDRIDESDYESEMSSPEGEFIFYTSNDTNCACPSENDSDDSDVEKGCGRLNCVNKNKNADKKAAIGNIFKNNAVRCEKPEIKEPDKPKPNLDQLFDSLLESESKPIPNNVEDITDDGKVNPMLGQLSNRRENVGPTLSPREHTNSTKSNKEERHMSLSKKEINPELNEHFPTKTQSDCNNKIYDKTPQSKPHSSYKNDEVSDTDSIGRWDLFQHKKPKESLGYSLMSEESTQVDLADIISDDNEITNKNFKKRKNDQVTKYNSEDEFDIDKPESLNRQYMHLILPAQKTSTCAQTDSKIDDYDLESGNESAPTKYMKGMSPAEAANMEIYTMVSAQGTQTVKSNIRKSGSSKLRETKSKSGNELDVTVVPRSRNRLQKYDVPELAHKSKSSKSIQTEKYKSVRLFECDGKSETEDDGKIEKHRDRGKKSDKIRRNSGTKSMFNEEFISPPDDVTAFTAPASRSTSEKHSPRKSDEGISTGHDHSAETLEQSLLDTGVALQRARRKCTVGKQNVLAEHWSSESEFDGGPARPNSADSIAASAPRKRKSKKKEGHHAGGRKTSRRESKGSARARGGARSDDSDAGGGGASVSRAPPGPKIRARAAHHYWSSEGEETAGPQPQHGWIVGDSHKKLVTMLAHAKGRKRTHEEKHTH